VEIEILEEVEEAFVPDKMVEIPLMKEVADKYIRDNKIVSSYAQSAEVDVMVISPEEVEYNEITTSVVFLTPVLCSEGTPPTNYKCTCNHMQQARYMHCIYKELLKHQGQGAMKKLYIV
jgi:hypothetical protein